MLIDSFTKQLFTAYRSLLRSLFILSFLLTLQACSGTTQETSTAQTPGLSLSLSSSQLSPGLPITATITYIDADGSAVSGILVALSTTNATLNFSQVVTDTNGKATATLTFNGLTSGDQLTVTTTQNDVGFSASKAYLASGTATVTTTKTLFMSGISLGSTSITYGASTFATVSIYEDSNNDGILQPDANNDGIQDTGEDALFKTVSDITFSSICTSNASATLDATVSTVNGRATSTYTSRTDTAGCEISDTITASASINATTLNKTTDITIASASLGSLSFVSAIPPTIYLQGSGGDSASTLKYKVTDDLGFPAKNKTVTFTLNNPSSGITLVHASNITDADGFVETIVRSGTTPFPVRVQASTGSGSSTLTTLSNELVVTTGLPDQQHFSLSASELNPEASVINTQVTFTATLSDRQGNPVVDNTQVNFMAESGTIQSHCLTLGGSCSAIWSSSLEGIQPTDHRATIMAYAIGGESYTDVNGNGFYDATDGEPFDNRESSGLRSTYLLNTHYNRQLALINRVLDEPFNDANANGIFDEPFNDVDNDNKYDLGEAFIDYNLNGIYNGNGTAAGETTFTDLNGDGTYNGSGIAMGESFQDVNFNNAHDSGEAFTDRTDLAGVTANTYDGFYTTGTTTRSEAFSDINNDAKLTGVGFMDLSEPWLDENEDGIYQKTELYIDENTSGTFSLRDGKYNGFMCTSGDTQCGNSTIMVRRALPLVLASSTPHILVKVTNGGSVGCANDDIVVENYPSLARDCSSLSIPNGGQALFSLYMEDTRGQILPNGSTIAIEAGEGTVNANEITIGNSNGDSGITTSFSIADSDSAETDAAVSSTIIITFTSPSGLVSSFNVGYTID